MSRSDSELVEELGWDSAFWGVPAARVQADDEDEIRRAVERCDRDGVAWASLLVPSQDLHLVASAVAAGFFPVDVRITLSTDAIPTAGAEHPVEEQLARPSDLGELSTIARTALTISRFFADPNLPDARCVDFYETWIRNSVDGPMADAVIVQRSDDGIDGFITVRTTAPDAATLPLVAVRPDRQGRGVGRSLMSSTMRWLGAHGVRSADVTTQLANVSAIRLYESHGFRFGQSGIWLHRWWGGASGPEGPP